MILILRNTLSIMKQQRIWPKTENLNHFYVSFVILFIACSPLWIGNLLHLIMLTQEDHKIGLAENIATVASFGGCQYIFICFLLKHETVKMLYEKLSNFEHFGKPTSFDKVNNRLDLLSKLCNYYCCIGACIYGSAALSEIPHCQKLKKELSINEVCGLFSSAYFPFDIDYFPAKQIVFVHQCLAGLAITRGAAIVSFSAFETSQHIIIRIRHLKEMLEKMFDDDGFVKRRQRLNFCIRYHSDIIEASRMFNFCYKNSLGVHVLFTGIICGCLSFEIVQEKSFGAVVHLFGWLFALFIDCFAGEFMIFESTSIADAAYKSNWYKVELSLRKDLKLLMMRAQKPLYMLVTPFGFLSLPLFVSIIKASYSFLTLLNNSV